jgi:hypothetical protein
VRRRLIRVEARPGTAREGLVYALCPILRVEADEVILLWAGCAHMRVCRRTGTVVGWGGWSDLHAPEVVALRKIA